MLRKIHFENFRALRDVELTLEPLTVLVGPNASGKSSVLRALMPTAPSNDDLWQHLSAAARVTFSFLDSAHQIVRAFGAVPRVMWSSNSAIDAQQIRLNLDLLKRHVRSTPATTLLSTGENLANVIDTLPRTTAIKLAKELCSLVPVYSDVDTPPAGTGARSIRFFDRWNPRVSYLADQVSDGTLYTLAMLSLKYQQPAPSIIAIEEPERGLHPYLVQEVMKLLRSLTTGPNPIQVILATQSAELLEYVRPEEVRFFSKDPADGSVKISSVDTSTDDWERAFKEYEHSLRDAWLSGSLGGVPGGSAPQ